ncbi:cytochrome c [Crenobacter sp. HX-7-9]|uniref:Cytochrome c n=2 Tax=Crenobacter caeni TaxID=2705474 RepID=A0A6B2KVK8_9NEIS|nr:cytochrome c [Crenobacter caeni]
METAVLVGASLMFVSEAFGEELSAIRQAELRYLVRQDCGACHGLTLQGGLGSPLTAAALAGKDDDGLVATILQGRPGSAMPPWQAYINGAEAQWIVDWLRAGGQP